MNCSSTNKSAATFMNLSITVKKEDEKKIQYKKVINKHPKKKKERGIAVVWSWRVVNALSFFMHSIMLV